MKIDALVAALPEALGDKLTSVTTALGEVTAGLAVAFDTTALSLGLSMVLVFATFCIGK